jgi:putative ABC transport system ATP-binding protein
VGSEGGSARHPDTILNAEGLVKAFQRGSEVVRALRGVDMNLCFGELVAVVGRSGSGKTTLLNVLSGWETADRGRIVWEFGDSEPGPDSFAWSRMAILPQSFGLIEELSVRKNVELPLRLSGLLDLRHRVDDLLSQLGLGEVADRFPLETSIGQQQRTGLARALVLQPTVLLADEPTGHQDVTWTSHIFEALAAASRKGTAVLVATHSEEVSRHADRVMSMREGQLHPSGAGVGD